MTDLNQSSPGSGLPGQAEAILVYQELCTNYRSIETFRGRLLGLLPLFSGSGIVLLLNSPFTEIIKREFTGQYIEWVGVLGCIVTLGLFSYESRGIRNCYRLIIAGQAIERQFGICGQFLSYPPRFLCFIGMRLAVCMIYSAVFAAWVFVALIPLALQGALWIALGVFCLMLAVFYALVWRADRGVERKDKLCQEVILVDH
jgi:hypothetical protein